MVVEFKYKHKHYALIDQVMKVPSNTSEQVLIALLSMQVLDSSLIVTVPS